MSDVPPALEKLRRSQRIVNAYHRIFKSEEGKIVLEDLALAMAWDEPAFAANKDQVFDSHFAAIRDGQRRVKLRIDAMLAKEVTGDGNREAKPPVITE